MSRQAVIVIHGIGEQWPMDTLRSFVKAVLPEPTGNRVKFLSVPDRLSESFELQKLLAPQTRSLAAIGQNEAGAIDHRAPLGAGPRQQGLDRLRMTRDARRGGLGLRRRSDCVGIAFD